MHGLISTIAVAADRRNCDGVESEAFHGHQPSRRTRFLSGQELPVITALRRAAKRYQEKDA